MTVTLPLMPHLQETSETPSYVCGRLDVDLECIAANYQTLKRQLSEAQCAAVLKADAYGMGLGPVGQRLAQEGCQKFFVAHVEEGLNLREALPHATIYVLTGCLEGSEFELTQNHLIPVLNDMGMLERWGKHGKQRGKKSPALIHVDTGMLRNGFDDHDMRRLKKDMSILEGLDLQGVMSHLACSPDEKSPMNQKQRKRFEALRHLFPHTPASLADTAGIYLGEAYHHDFVRPGKGLFGLFNAPKGLQLTQAFTLKARIIQIRHGKAGESVGYGACNQLDRPSRLATLGIGYADGLDRRSASAGYALIKDFKAPLIGSLSMDYTVIDVTDIPEDLCHVGDWVQLTGPNQPFEEMATELGTISRELSTRLGRRLHRIYT